MYETETDAKMKKTSIWLAKGEAGRDNVRIWDYDLYIYIYNIIYIYIYILGNQQEPTL